MQRMKMAQRSWGVAQLIKDNPSTLNISEQFRVIRTNLIYMLMNKNETPTISVTSALPHSGKSFIASNLASFLADSEMRVLIIDADMRNPNLHKVFNTKNTLGLSTLLSRKYSEVSDVILTTCFSNMFLLPSGKIPTNPAELLARPRMKEIIEEVKQTFDLVIFDLPPILLVTDAQIMASKTDGVIFVCPKGKVKKKELLASKQLLDQVNAKVLGSILNFSDVDKEIAKYYNRKVLF